MSEETRELLLTNALRVFVSVIAYLVISQFGAPGFGVAITVFLAVLFADFLRRFMIHTRKDVTSDLLPTRDVLIAARNKAELNFILKKQFSRVREKFNNDCNSISIGRFEFRSDTIDSLSFDAMDKVDENCLLTYPINKNQRLLAGDDGDQSAQVIYHQRMVEAKKRIAIKSEKKLTRIFLVETTSDILPETLNLIERSRRDDLNIRFLYSDNANGSSLEPALVPTEIEDIDFGYYSTVDQGSWVMVLKESQDEAASATSDSLVYQRLHYVIDTRPGRVKTYRKFAEQLIEDSITYEEFIEKVKEPINSQWQQYFKVNGGFEMNEPHGLSSSEADHIADLISQRYKRRSRDTSAPQVVVLGRTTKILKSLVARLPEAEIFSLDAIPPIGELHPRVEGVRYLTGNWLDENSYSEIQECDAFFFDEALNNLSRVQLNFLFPLLQKLLRHDGVGLGRILGRFEPHGPSWSGDSFMAAIKDLREHKGKLEAKGDDLKHETFASRIIIHMMSKGVGVLDELTHLVDCSLWNKQLDEMDDIAEDEFALWRLPFEFKLLAPTRSLLQNEALQAGFSLEFDQGSFGDYTAENPDINDFYRIARFEKK